MNIFLPKACNFPLSSHYIYIKKLDSFLSKNLSKYKNIKSVNYLLQSKNNQLSKNIDEFKDDFDELEDVKSEIEKEIN